MDTGEVITAINTRMSATGLFDAVLDHEPITAPTSTGFVWACWVAWFRPLKVKSGLASTSMQLMLRAWIMRNALTEPRDTIDRDLLACVDTAIRESSADISFGMTGAGVWTDLLGDDSDGLYAETAFIIFNQNEVFRVADMRIPVVLTDYFPQARTDVP